MVGHGGSSAGSYLADPTSPIPSHCASIVATSTVRVKFITCSHFRPSLLTNVHLVSPPASAKYQISFPLTLLNYIRTLA